jgi:phage terminase small subunit
MSDETQQNMAKLSMLTPTQRVFVMHRARGKSITVAAAAAGVNRNTPTSQWDADLIAAAILEVQQQMINSPVEAIGPLIPHAVERLNEALTKGEEWAVKETFDRAWGKAQQTTKTEQSGGLKIEIVYVDD